MRDFDGITKFSKLTELGKGLRVSRGGLKRAEEGEGQANFDGINGMYGISELILRLRSG
jgi:hypothetical protein